MRGLATRFCILLGAATAALLVQLPATAAAQTGQVAMFQDDSRLLSAPGPTLEQMRELGVGVVRVSVHWDQVAPAHRPSGFNPANPATYPGGSWSVYDQIVTEARRDGIAVDLSLSGAAPLWATGGGQPKPGGFGEWKPSAAAFGAFVQAVGTRYSGSYDPLQDKTVPGDPNDLPRVSFWELWNEPNFGQDLAPQAIRGSAVPAAPWAYRSLLDTSWNALQHTGHGRDAILIGNLDARGQSSKPHRGAPDGLPGKFGATKPLAFVRTLYCVSSKYKQLRGGAAGVVGCPATAAGSRRFRSQHPALFRATGFAAHPYPINLPPTQASATDPDYIEFNEIGRFAGALDRLQRIYGSGKRFPIYNNEYGYITNPPNHSVQPKGPPKHGIQPKGHFVSPATAAGFINWAEYLSYKNPRLASTMQYLLYDPNPRLAPEFGGFASGLIFYPNGPRKPGYNAYRLPLFLPVTSAHRGHSLEVWGAVRPAHFASIDSGGTPQQVQIQFQPGSRGPFKTLRTVTIHSSRGYIDLRVTFPGSGSVRLSWSYPPSDPLLTPSLANAGDANTVFSRTVRVKVK